MTPTGRQTQSKPLPFYEIEKIYQAAKAEYTLDLVFVKDGNNLITFGEDKDILIEVLPVNPFGQNTPEGGVVEFAGFTIDKAESFMSQLIDQGFTIAVVEQVDPATIANRLM